MRRLLGLILEERRCLAIEYTLANEGTKTGTQADGGGVLCPGSTSTNFFPPLLIFFRPTYLTCSPDCLRTLRRSFARETYRHWVIFIPKDNKTIPRNSVVALGLSETCVSATMQSNTEKQMKKESATLCCPLFFPEMCVETAGRVPARRRREGVLRPGRVEPQRLFPGRLLLRPRSLPGGREVSSGGTGEGLFNYYRARPSPRRETFDAKERRMLQFLLLEGSAKVFLCPWVGCLGFFVRGCPQNVLCTYQ